MSTKPTKEMIERRQAQVRKFEDLVKHLADNCPEAGKRAWYPGDRRCSTSCGKHSWYATCIFFMDAARAIPIGEPYQMPAAEYLFEKSWANPEQLEGKDVITVIEILGVPVHKKRLDDYVNHIVDRLRMAQRERVFFDFERDRMLLRVRELEDLRREIHGAILASAGFTPGETSEESVAFREAVEGYLEREAKKFGVV